MSNNRPSRSNYRAIKLEKARNLHYVSRTKSLAVQTLNTSHDVPLNSILNTFCVSSVYHTCSPALAYAHIHTRPLQTHAAHRAGPPPPPPYIHEFMPASSPYIPQVSFSLSLSLFLSLTRLAFSQYVWSPSCADFGSMHYIFLMENLAQLQFIY